MACAERQDGIVEKPVLLLLVAKKADVIECRTF
jgi:hypothetical protein